MISAIVRVHSIHSTKLILNIKGPLNATLLNDKFIVVLNLFLSLKIAQILLNLLLHSFDFTHLFFGEHAVIARPDHHSSFASDAETSSSLISSTHSATSFKILARLIQCFASVAAFESIGPVD